MGLLPGGLVGSYEWLMPLLSRYSGGSTVRRCCDGRDPEAEDVTLAAVWQSQTGAKPQLCFASDSRTTPGPIDGVTKVGVFRRSDLVGVWAGDYRYASLILANLEAFLSSHRSMERRDIDVLHALDQARHAIRGHLDSATSERAAWLVNEGARVPDATTVLVGGYSILQSEFRVLRVRYLVAEEKWIARTEAVAPGDLRLIGDETKAARALARLARQRSGRGASDGWRMEPLLAVQRAIVDPTKDTIGGKLQFAKAYIHGESDLYGVRDPLKGSVSFGALEVPRRAEREFEASGRVVNLAAWSIDDAQFR